jgi:peroxiredoxin
VVTTGSDAPDFTLPGLDGLTYALHEARNAGPVLLVFWQAHCGACKMVAPYLTRLNESYENLGWTLWAIAQDGPEEARRFVEEQTFGPTVLVDGPGLRVSDAYDPPSTPAFYFIEPGEGVTLEGDGFDKDLLNDISRRVAQYTSSGYVEVAPAGDGNPPFRPG